MAEVMTDGKGNFLVLNWEGLRLVADVLGDGGDGSMKEA